MRVVDKSISPWSEEGLPQGRRRVGIRVPGGENRVGRGREARGRGMPRDPWPGSGRAGKCPEGQRGPLRAEAGAPPSSRMTPAPSCSWSLGTRRPRCNSRLSASLGPLQDPLPQPSLPRTGSYTVCLPGVRGGASDRLGSPPPRVPTERVDTAALACGSSRPRAGRKGAWRLGRPLLADKWSLLQGNCPVPQRNRPTASGKSR